MSYPKFYDPMQVGTLFAPKSAIALTEGAALGLAPAARSAGAKVQLLLVDPQIDFIHADGALSVPGAIADTGRTIDWIYRNLSQLTAISASLDTHLPYQIFHPAWWVDRQGNHPGPFTTITLAQYLNGDWRPLMRLPFVDHGNKIDWAEYYLSTLEAKAKKTLMIWPYHCLLGTPGHAIEPSLLEAIMYHAGARYNQPQFLVKGNIPKTEHYSILEPEVKVTDHPQGGLNTDFLDMLGTYDLIYIAGQAKSHCVYETVNSILTYFDTKAPDVIARIRILGDCTSAVTGFEAQADAAFAEFQRRYGLTIASSTDPIG